MPRAEQATAYQVDLRYHGQGFEITVPADSPRPSTSRRRAGGASGRIRREHHRLFTFLLEGNEHEFVNARATVTARRRVGPVQLPAGGTDQPRRGPATRAGSAGATDAGVYERPRFEPANVVTGPAIVTEMDSTTLVLPEHAGAVHRGGNLLVRPRRADSHGADHRARHRRVAAVDVDVVTLDIIENALRNARYEMDAVLFRTAMSPGIREQHDEFPLIADPEGRMVVGQFGLFIAGLLGRYEGTIEEGDVLLT